MTLKFEVPRPGPAPAATLRRRRQAHLAADRARAIARAERSVREYARAMRADT